MSHLKELSQRQVPLERVVPLNSNRLVTFVNHFIISIVQQLNELSSVVDSRLYDINDQIQRCNANLVILEMKLNSINGLSSVPTAVNTSAQNNDINVNQMNSLSETTTNDDMNSVEHNRSEDMNGLTTCETTGDTTRGEPNEDMDESEDKTMDEEVVEEEDPRIAKYKKMFHLGIPLDAVHQKMRLDGVDTSLLKTSNK